MASMKAQVSTTNAATASATKKHRAGYTSRCRLLRPRVHATLSECSRTGPRSHPARRACEDGDHFAQAASAGFRCGRIRKSRSGPASPLGELRVESAGAHARVTGPVLEDAYQHVERLRRDPQPLAICCRMSALGLRSPCSIWLRYGLETPAWVGQLAQRDLRLFALLPNVVDCCYTSSLPDCLQLQLQQAQVRRVCRGTRASATVISAGHVSPPGWHVPGLRMPGLRMPGLRMPGLRMPFLLRQSGPGPGGSWRRPASRPGPRAGRPSSRAWSSPRRPPSPGSPSLRCRAAARHNRLPAAPGHQVLGPGTGPFVTPVPLARWTCASRGPSSFAIAIMPEAEGGGVRQVQGHVRQVKDGRVPVRRVPGHLGGACPEREHVLHGEGDVGLFCHLGHALLRTRARSRAASGTAGAARHLRSHPLG